MLIYSILMFLVAALFVPISVAIYRGKTELIHDYHQTKVTDKAAYGKSFGKALLVIPFGAFISGAMGMVDDSDAIAIAAVSVLVVSLLVGAGCICAVQKKYNRGIF